MKKENFPVNEGEACSVLRIESYILFLFQKEDEVFQREPN